MAGLCSRQVAGVTLTAIDGDNREVVPEPGQAVLVRGRPAAVRERLDHTDAATQETFHVVDVEYIDGWDFPGEDRLIWEREWGARILRDVGLPRGPGELEFRPDPPQRYRAFLDAVRWSSLSRVPGLTSDGPELTAPWLGAVAVEPYQLWPVMKALEMPRVSLLLADDVGLGKTIQAGLVLTELMARRRIRRILIVTPASLQLQWREEMRDKFNLDFTVLDRSAMTDVQREFGMDTNPWAVTPRAITSMDFLRQPDVRSQFLAASTNLERGHELAWDALVVDEAHNVSPRNFTERSERSLTIQDIAPHFEHRLFLTATPHNGFTAQFTGLLELLDPVRFRQTSELSDRDRDHLGTVIVRRLKSELNARAEQRGDPRPFPRREVEGRPFDWSAEEVELVEALRDYKAAGEKLLRTLPKGERNVGRFVFSLLSKRLLSSSYAFARTWWQHIAGYEAANSELGEVDVARRRLESETSDDIEKARREEDVARQGASWLARYGEALTKPRDRVGDALRALGWGPEVVGYEQLPEDGDLPPDGKWEALERWLEERLLRDGELRDDERVILFTEYKDTHEYVLTRLAQAGWEDPQVRFLFGGSSLQEREDVKFAFNDPEDPLRVLVATEVAAEGLNLQATCRYVFHWELPWNPMRLEQRNGRVDRHGQPRDVTAFHFTSDHDEDVKFLDYVVRKVHQVREDLGSVGEVIDLSIQEHFTVGGVDEQEIEARIDRTLELAPDREDLGSVPDVPVEDRSGEAAEAMLRASEQRLRLDERSLARLLAAALKLDGGLLEPEGDLYRLIRVPASWTRVVDDHLRLRTGVQKGALPRISFDPDRFVDIFDEETDDARSVFRSRKDIALVRLGHPLVTRAIARLRQQLWEPNERAMARWTISAAAVTSPSLIVPTLVQASNTLRETLHAELLEVAVDLDEPATVPDEAHRVPLEPSDLDAWRAWLADRWHELRDRCLDAVEERRFELTDQLERLLDSLHAEERTRQAALYDQRLKELQKEPTDRAVKRLQRELIRAEKQAVNLTFFEDENIDRQKRVAELERKVEQAEFERANAQRERLQQRLVRERERMIEQIIPRRFSLSRLQLTPVAVELVVPEGVRP